MKNGTMDQSGRPKLDVTPADALEFAARQQIHVEGLSADDCLATLDPRPLHNDPFDEMLLVHAQRLGARLLTRDRRLIGHPLALAA